MASDTIGISRKLLTHSSLRAKALWILGTTMGLFTLTSGAFLLNQQQVREARGWTDHGRPSSIPMAKLGAPPRLRSALIPRRRLPRPGR